jgi:uncharacterized protein YheU (UPF0270 family)
MVATVEKKDAVIVPYDQLKPESLNGVIEEFVTRDGTDYGVVEVSLETKISRVLNQLKSGKAVIVFDNIAETCTILKSNDPVLNSIRN